MHARDRVNLTWPAIAQLGSSRMVAIKQDTLTFFQKVSVPATLAVTLSHSESPFIRRCACRSRLVSSLRSTPRDRHATHGNL